MRGEPLRTAEYLSKIDPLFLPISTLVVEVVLVPLLLLLVVAADIGTTLVLIEVSLWVAAEEDVVRVEETEREDVGEEEEWCSQADLCALILCRRECAFLRSDELDLRTAWISVLEKSGNSDWSRATCCGNVSASAKGLSADIFDFVGEDKLLPSGLNVNLSLSCWAGMSGEDDIGLSYLVGDEVAGT